MINPFGLSATKVFIALMVWISCYLAISTFVLKYKKIKLNLPGFSFFIYLLIIIWNIFNICRSFYDGNQPLTTILGNNETSLALLVPFALSFSIDKTNLRTINKLFVNLIIVGMPAYILLLLSMNGSHNFVYDKSFSVIFYGVVFLIPIIPFEKGKINIIILIGSIFCFYLAVITSYRIMLIRIPLLYVSVIAIYINKWFKLKSILILAILSLSLPFYFLIQSVVTGESAFEKYSPQTKNPELTDDTRTFLYQEVYDDLYKNKMLLIGKGGSGTYYSTYFDEYGGDTSNRLSVEVGILALLLKGGYIAVFLNLLILFLAIYLALFNTNNHFVMCIGFMLVIHTIILFITNYIDYSLYNVALWFFIGVCLSKEIRELNDEEIKNILINGANS